MATHPTARSDKRNSAPAVASPGGQATKIGRLLGRLLLGVAILTVTAVPALYLAWDYLPARAQYVPRYVQMHLLPQAPPPEGVATPVTAVNPEQALDNLRVSESEPAGEEAVTSDPPEAGAAPESRDPAESTATPQPDPTPTPEPLHTSPGPTALLDNIRHEYQGWNNCGPATLAMNLSHFGRRETQEETAPFLKPDPDDKNVSPNGMAAYARHIGLEAEVIVGMDTDMLRTFLANGIPVIVESWFIPEPDDQMGHYLLTVGYEGDQLHFYDSYRGPNVVEDAASFDQLWKVFNRTAVLVWSPDQDALVQSILGELSDPQVMHERALATAREEVEADPEDKFAWFNLGTNLVALGEYEKAAQAFDMSRSLQLPWRMLWYQFGPYEAYYETGRYQELIDLATATLEAANNLEESYYWRGRARAARGQEAEARRDFQQALKLNPNFTPAEEALASLP